MKKSDIVALSLSDESEQKISKLPYTWQISAILKSLHEGFIGELDVDDAMKILLQHHDELSLLDAQKESAMNYSLAIGSQI